MIWEIELVPLGTHAKEDIDKLAQLLFYGWEPFAVTQSHNSGYVYHFRRKVYGNE